MENEQKAPKNKLMTIMLVLLAVILLAGTIAVVIILRSTGGDAAKEEPSIDEVLESSVDIPEMTTNLASDDFIRISFKIQTNDPDAMEELTKRDFQAKDLIIQKLSEMTADELKGEAGKQKLTETLKTNLNSIMQDGTVEAVYITSYIIQ
ncbi:flagellar basal body-associated protein FliL [Domibacillus enclensis]|uniref:Flagellar protein FliL n=1 Tax=Domibacillus enclensis TaxID=1017273 RepID=A0A1N6ULB2_9BACI|nr:flagellar basal body-associated protein FliL [Domibacillus enclensis]OXS78556.1 flagellar basal body-associated protein FliL [Domibacillus enclensis]SIQ66322.1 flagellar FliL protein [Domibacillus enclensis]